MLSRVQVRNLCCYDNRTVAIDFGPETIFVGANNSGKSTILAAINLVRDYFLSGGLRWNNEYYSLINFDNAVNGHDLTRTINIQFTLDQKTYGLSISTGGSLRGVIALDAARRPITQINENVFKQIWYVRPNRALLPNLVEIIPTGTQAQPLAPDCSNLISFLVERFTDKDSRWDKFEEWLKKIDPDISNFKPPIKGRSCSFETLMGNMPVNASLQGSGFHNAASIIASLVFSPKGSTIIVEEPEVHLHKNSQEVLADLFNEIVSSEKKQVIFSTHSWDMLLPFASDVLPDAAKRSSSHIRAHPKSVRMYMFNKISRRVDVKKYPLASKTFRQLKDDLKITWG
jgi:predicted ATPase